MYILINALGELDVYAQEDDACYTCLNIIKCPLMSAFQSEVAIIRYESISIDTCGLYVEKEPFQGITGLRY